MISPKVLYEDNYILVLDKPAGWVTNKSDTAINVPTVQEWVEERYEFGRLKKVDKESDFIKRSGIVHRIDKDTSGLLLVAKTPDCFLALQRQFKAREVKKRYVALVHGLLPKEEGRSEINAPVGRLPWRRDRFGILAGGREAKTFYEVTGNFTKGEEKYSLLSLFPKTGRTHQIRVHLKYLGYPIVSDPFYAGRKTSRKDQKWCPRLFLHASGITFKHPKTGVELTYESKLPQDLKDSLSLLSQSFS